MANYLSITEEEKKQMLEKIGARSVEDLFCDIPGDLRIRKLNLPDGVSQQEASDLMGAMAQKNKIYPVIMRGAGAYNHYTPPVVKSLLNRGEFLTAYTPYQPEMSQGVLQSIFEYQTMICALTGMDASNASVYSGATAAADAVLMCLTPTKNRVLVPDNINPDTLKVIKTYISRLGAELEIMPSSDGLVDYDLLKQKLSDTSACLYFEQVNYFGLIESAEEIIRLVHETATKAIMGVNPIAAALLKSAGECGADFAVGNGGSLGLPLSFGGPYLGFIACTNKELRKLNGRIVGETVDNKGNRAFVLTLQAREQHIRREKALNNICSNQAFCALACAMYLTAMGPKGLEEVATSCTSLAHYAAEEMVKAGAQLKYSEISGAQVNKGEFFHEFVTVHKTKAAKILEKLDKIDILGGLEIGKHEILWCFTEMVKKEDIDRAVEVIKRA